VYTDIGGDMAKGREKLHQSCTAEKRDLHLGLGPYSTPDEIKWTCQYLFLEALLAIAPHIVAELFRTEVVTELAAVGVVAERFLTDPVQWCRDHHLTFRGEVCEWALHAVRIAQGLKQHAPDGLPVWPVVPGVRSRPGRLSVSPCVITPGWDSFGPETLADAKARFYAACDQHLESIEAATKAPGAESTPVKRKPEHFIWAVRFQCLEDDVPTIAEEVRELRKSDDVDERAINQGISPILKRIGVDRRSVPSGPKPN
jgi:hypothetical protein